MSDRVVNIDEIREHIGYSTKGRGRPTATGPTVNLNQNKSGSFVIRINDPAEPIGQRQKYVASYKHLSEAQAVKKKIEAFLANQ